MIYEARIQVYIEQGTKASIENGSRLHALALLRKFIADSKESVMIYAKSFKADIYNDWGLYKIVCEAIDRGVKFSVAIQEKTPDKGSALLWSLLRSHFREQVGSVSSIEGIEQIKNFFVVDDRFIRLEDDQESRTGKGIFYDKEKNDEKVNVFVNDLMPHLSPVSVFS